MELNILYGCDDKYAPYTGISMLSLLENNKDMEEITIYLAAMKISNENLAKFNEIANRYNRKLVVLNTEKAFNEIKRFKCNGWNGSLATWLRFFVLEQIPRDVDKLLWLDSDTIIADKLDELILLDLGEHPIACVCDSICYFERFRLGIKENEPYYNAGVIFFNLSLWRKNQILYRMMEFLPKHIEYYKANDQDLLNDFFRGKTLRLDPKYNVQGFQIAYPVSTYFKVYPWLSSAYYERKEVEIALKQPCVVHFFRFLGDYPWENVRNNYHPSRDLFLFWKSKSPWKGYNEERKKEGFTFLIEKVLYRVLPKRLFLSIFAFISNIGVPKKPCNRFR